MIRADAVVTTMEPYKMSATVSSSFLVARFETDDIKSENTNTDTNTKPKRTTNTDLKCQPPYLPPSL